MTNIDCEALNLSYEECAILKAYRGLSESKKKAVAASKKAFIDWLAETLSWIWDKIKNLASEFWIWLKSL